MRLFYSESNLGQIDYWDKRQIQIGGIQPNMILGMLLGADFMPQESFDADITPACLDGLEPRNLPSPEELLRHDLIRLFACINVPLSIYPVIQEYLAQFRKFHLEVSHISYRELFSRFYREGELLSFKA